MNGDIATAVAFRPEDRALFARPPAGHRYCWRCSSYKPGGRGFGGRCWDCTHAPAREQAARMAVYFLRDGRRREALQALAAAVDEQAAAEGIDSNVTAVMGDWIHLRGLEFRAMCRLRGRLLASRLPATGGDWS